MSSLWTPGGEHRVPPPEQTEHAPSEQGGAPGAEPLDPADAARMEELQARLLATPAEAIVANHCYGLFELAALHLSQSPPNLAAARLAIDALGALVDGLGDRLGQYGEEMPDALHNLRLAFVSVSGVAGAAQGPPEG